MPTTRPEDVAAMFDLPPPEPESAEDAAAAAEAAEAALAAELAAALESGEAADDAPDSRTNQRVDVSSRGLKLGANPNAATLARRTGWLGK